MPVLTEQLDVKKGTCIVFVKTKWGADKLSDRLRDAGHRADAIHGDLRQKNVIKLSDSVQVVFVF